MPKLITLVEDEFIELKARAEHLIQEAEAIVEKLIHHKNPATGQSATDAPSHAYLARSSSLLKAQLGSTLAVQALTSASTTEVGSVLQQDFVAPLVPPVETASPSPEVATVGQIAGITPATIEAAGTLVASLS